MAARNATGVRRGLSPSLCPCARKADWAEFVPEMRSKVMRFEVVDEDEWAGAAEWDAVSRDSVKRLGEQTRRDRSREGDR